MANDVDVKIGIQVDANTAGAEAAKNAIDGVKSAAEQAATAGQNAVNAAEQAVDAISADMAGVNSSVDSLLDSLSGLTRRDAAGVLNGISSALRGIYSGDVSTGLAGAATGLSSLARALPNPAVAIGLSVGIGLIVKAFESFQPPVRELNEFGETLEEERARLDKISKENVKWSGISDGLDAVKAKFDEANQAAQALLSATESIFSAKNSAAISALKRQADTAEKSGDAEGAAKLQAEAERIGQIDELVKVGLKIQESQIAQASELKRISDSKQALMAAQQAAQEQKDKVSAIEDEVVGRTGNMDAARVGSKAYDGLIQSLQARLEKAESITEPSISYAERTGNPMAAGLRALKDDEPSVRELIESLKNLQDENQKLKDRTADTEKKYADILDSSGQALIKLKANEKALKLSQGELSQAFGPEVSEAAAKQVQAMMDVNQSFLEGLTATGNTAQDVIGLVDAAVADISSVSMRAETAAEQLKQAIARMWDSESSQALDAAQQDAQKYRDVLDAIGSSAQTSGSPNPAEVRQSIEETRAAFGNAAEAMRSGGEAVGSSGAAAATSVSAAGTALQGAMSGTAAAASEVTNQVSGIAGDFRDKLLGSSRDMASAATGLARMTNEFNSTITRLANEIAQVRRLAFDASETSRLAVQQNRNAR